MLGLTTIVLADDHPIVRRGLRTLLETESGLQMPGEAGDALEAVQLVECLQPDVLTVDVLKPGLSGLEVIRQVSQRTAQTRVIVLSMHANETYDLEALRDGASGYVLKGSSITDLVQAVRDVVSRGRYLSAPLSEPAIEADVEKAQDRALALTRASPAASGRCCIWSLKVIPAPRSPSAYTSARARSKPIALI